MKILRDMKINLLKLTAIAGIIGSTLSTGSLNAVPSVSDLKVAVVNFKQCIEQSKYGKKEQATFENFKKQLEEILMDKDKTLSEVANKLNDPDYLDSLSAEAENELKHKFRTMSQELSQLQGQYYQTLNQANMKIIQTLTEKITQASKNVATSKGLHLVLNEESGFFYAPTLDITKDVVASLDDAFQKDPKKDAQSLPGVPK